MIKDSIDNLDILVEVRRQWNDWRFAKYRLSDIENLAWDWAGGGVPAPTPQPLVHGYVWCDAPISGEVAHSCQHGPKPHRIKSVSQKKGMKKSGDTFSRVLALVRVIKKPSVAG